MQADILVCRTEHPLPANVRTKLARFCNVGTDAVIESIDADSIYDVPLLMQEEKFDEVVLRKLGMDAATRRPTSTNGVTSSAVTRTPSAPSRWAWSGNTSS